MFRNTVPVDVKIVERDRSFEFKLPQYKSEGAAGMDLIADIPMKIWIKPGKRVLIPTGIAIYQKNPNFVAVAVGRSGNGINAGVLLSQGAGIIDSDYTGEISIPLTNTDLEEPFLVEPCDRIAQLLLLPVVSAEFNLVKELGITARGAGGFGSTGRQ